MSTPAPRRRKDAREKAAAIERAATDLVLERGYDAVTVDMICELAGVSQRTFFNHFGTKDAALLGTAHPRIDEAAAAAFIASDAPLLAGAARLVQVDPGDAALDPVYLARRIRAIGSNPTLMAHQLDRVAALDAQLEDVVRRRLERQFPEEPAADLAAQAALLTHLVAGLMRYIGHAWAKEAAEGSVPAVDPASIERLLSQALAKLR